MAVRGDLADVRLADQVFAPHYAAAVMVMMGSAAPLLSGTGDGNEVLASLTQGKSFEVLDYSGGWAWGIDPESGLVGYVDRSAIAVPVAGQ